MILHFDVPVPSANFMPLPILPSMVSIEYNASGEVSYQKIAIVVAIVILKLGFVYKSLAVISYPLTLQRVGQREGKSWGEMNKQFETDSLRVLNDVYQNVRALPLVSFLI